MESHLRCGQTLSDEAQVMAMFDSLDRGGEPLTRAGQQRQASCLRNPRWKICRAERINRVLSDQRHGLFLCCREAVKRMSHKHGGKGGAIVNVSTLPRLVWARAGEYVDYAASKGAVDSPDYQLSLEVAAQAIPRKLRTARAVYTDIPASGEAGAGWIAVKSLPAADAARRPAEEGRAGDGLAAEREGVIRDGQFIELAGGEK